MFEIICLYDIVKFLLETKPLLFPKFRFLQAVKLFAFKIV